MKTTFETENDWEASHLLHAINYRIEMDDLRNELRSHLKHGAPLTIDEIYDKWLRIEADYPIKE